MLVFRMTFLFYAYWWWWLVFDNTSITTTIAFTATLMKNPNDISSMKQRNNQQRPSFLVTSTNNKRSSNCIISMAAGASSRSLSVRPSSRSDDHNESNIGIGIGIDLGTTNSAVAYYDAITNLPKIVPIPNNGNTIPSIVAFVPTNHSNNVNLQDINNDHRMTLGDISDNTAGDNTSNIQIGKDFTVLIGKDAIEYEYNLRDQVATTGEKESTSKTICSNNIYHNVKRIIGTGGKMSPDVRDIIPHVVINPSGKTYKKDSLSNSIYDAEYHPTYLRYYDDNNNQTAVHIPPELVSSCIIKHLIDTAENYTSNKVTRAVIGVPAYFNDAQREATMKACTMAGISKVRLLREPEAAALAYGAFIQQDEEDQKSNDRDTTDDDDDELVLVFDLGGGTFDVSMLLMGGGVTEILSTSGNTQLGGSDWDAKISSFLLKLIQQRQETDQKSVKKWPEGIRQKIVRSAEQARIYLSNNNRINLALPLFQDEWRNLMDSRSIILPREYDFPFVKDAPQQHRQQHIPDGFSNGTHYIFQWTRSQMELLCSQEFNDLVRPIREVAIMSGALLPGDSNPAAAEAAMFDYEQQLNSERTMDFEDFYSGSEGGSVDTTNTNNQEDTDIAPAVLDELLEMEMRNSKKQQQSGRKRARVTAKEERKFREEKRKVEETLNAKLQRSNSDGNQKNIQIRDGISGKPIAKIVLVGGATRMPAIGRLLKALTGIVPKMTVNPNEAVALGCAVHISNLDGNNSSNDIKNRVVLNPMQAAIVRAMVQAQQQKDKKKTKETMKAKNERTIEVGTDD